MIQKKWTWPGMGEDIKDIVQACEKCQRYKKPRVRRPQNDEQEGSPIQSRMLRCYGPPAKNGEGKHQHHNLHLCHHQVYGGSSTEGRYRYKRGQPSSGQGDQSLLDSLKHY